jgi:hypothetical protein
MVLVSGGIRDPRDRELVNAHAIRVLPKPIDFAALRNVVRGLAGNAA